MKSHLSLLDGIAETLCNTYRDGIEGDIVLTGASGFLASNIAAVLELVRRRGLEVTVVCTARRPMTETPLFEYLDLSISHRWKIQSAEHLTIPAGDRLTVFHAGSHASPRNFMNEPLATFHANTTGICQAFEQARKSTRARVVYFSSAEVYGQPDNSNIPTTESYTGNLSIMDARSIYGESKRMAEVLGIVLSNQTGVEFQALRPWNVYGPGQRLDDGRIPFDFLQQAIQTKRISLLSNGRPTRAFCYVTDALHQIFAVAFSEQTASNAWNIGSDKQEASVLDVALKAAAVVGLSPNAVTFNPNAANVGLLRCVPDTAAVDALGSQRAGTITLDDGMATTHDWISWLLR